MDKIAITDKVLSTSSYNGKAFSPLGLDTSLDITSQYALASNMLTGDANMDGSLTVGVNNLLDKEAPSFYNEGNVGWRDVNTGLYDVLGRTVFVRIQQTF